jgi:predicted molibdopterin-dependent oxidoreductase YjgC
MFRKISGSLPAAVVDIVFDGRPMQASAGETVAAALLAHGVVACRSTPLSNSARGPYCLMGVCFECLVTVDGRPNQQGCMVVVRQHMRVDRQRGAPSASGLLADEVADGH